MDLYRDANRHGGIYSSGFMKAWGGHVRRYQNDGGVGRACRATSGQRGDRDILGGGRRPCQRGSVTIHDGGSFDSHLLVPIIPAP